MQLRKKEAQKLKSVSIRLPEDVYKSLREECLRYDLSMNAAVNQILLTWREASRAMKKGRKK